MAPHNSLESIKRMSGNESCTPAQTSRSFPGILCNVSRPNINGGPCTYLAASLVNAMGVVWGEDVVAISVLGEPFHKASIIWFGTHGTLTDVTCESPTTASLLAGMPSRFTGCEMSVRTEASGNGVQWSHWRSASFLCHTHPLLDVIIPDVIRLPP